MLAIVESFFLNNSTQVYMAANVGPKSTITRLLCLFGFFVERLALNDGANFRVDIQTFLNSPCMCYWSTLRLILNHLTLKEESNQKNVKKWYALGCPPCPVRITTRSITFLVGDPYKPSFATWEGGQPKVCMAEFWIHFFRDETRANHGKRTPS